MAAKKMPCIRGLKEFSKGCPKKAWDGEDGCPAWITFIIPDPNNPCTKTYKSQCVDIWQAELLYRSLGLTELNTISVNSLENALCEQDPNDPSKARPKWDRAFEEMVKLTSNRVKATDDLVNRFLSLVENRSSVVSNVNDAELIEGDNEQSTEEVDE